MAHARTVPCMSRSYSACRDGTEHAIWGPCASCRHRACYAGTTRLMQAALSMPCRDHAGHTGDAEHTMPGLYSPYKGGTKRVEEVRIVGPGEKG